MDQSSCPSQASPNFFHHTASKIATPYDAPTTGHAVAPAHFAVPRQHSTWLLSRTADRTSKSILRWRSGARLPRAPERPPPAATPGPQRLRRAQHPRRGALAPGGSAALHGLDRRRRLESGRAARGNTGPRTWERGSATTFQVINGTDGQSHKCTVTATFSDGDILQADTLLRFATSRVMTDRTALTLILLCAALAVVVGYWP